MNIIERILPILDKNYPLEIRDVIWNSCMTYSTQIKINEENLEKMCTTHLVSGFGGDGGQKELVKLAQALGVSGISFLVTRWIC